MRQSAKWILMLLLGCALIFQVGLRERIRDTGLVPGVSDGTWRNLSLYSLNFARNWHAGGALDQKFSLNFSPRSIEIGKGRPYFSYSPVFMLPILIFDLFSGKAPELSMIYSASLWLHFLTAFLLSLAVFLFLEKNSGPRLSLFLSLSAFFAFARSPVALNWFPGLWWPDSLEPAAVMLLLFSEFFPLRKWNAPLEFLLFLFASAVGWLPAFFALLLLVFRFLERKKMKPAAAGFLSFSFLYGLNVYLFAHRKDFVTKILERTSLAPPPPNEIPSTGEWLRLLELQVGHAFPAIYLALLALFPILLAAYFRRRKQTAVFPAPLKAALLLLFACFLHNAVFRQHYRIHPYNSLKFAFLFSFVPFLLFAPVSARIRGGKTRAAAALALGAAMILHPLLNAGAHREFQENAIHMDQKKVDACAFIYRNTSYADIVYSLDFSTEDAPQELEPLCFKSVRRTDDPYAIKRELLILNWNSGGRLEKTAHKVKLFISGEIPAFWKQFLKLPAAASSPSGALYEVDLDSIPRLYY